VEPDITGLALTLTGHSLGETMCTREATEPQLIVVAKGTTKRSPQKGNGMKGQSSTTEWKGALKGGGYSSKLLVVLM